MLKREELIRFARTLVGTPYHHQGRLPGVGLDCIGVLTAVAQQFGLTFHDYQNYAPIADGIILPREFDKALIRIPKKQVQPGSILVFWVRRQSIPNHAAIATDRGIIHAHNGLKFVTEHSLEWFWEQRLDRCYDYPGIDPEPFSQEFKWTYKTSPQEEAERRRIQQLIDGGCCG